MASTALDTNRVHVTLGGFWLSLLSLLRLKPELSNWLVLDKKTGMEFRLSYEEQDALNRPTEMVQSIFLSPDFQDTPKGIRKAALNSILEEYIVAIVSARQGDPSDLQELQNKGLGEFTDYVKQQLASWEEQSCSYDELP